MEESSHSDLCDLSWLEAVQSVCVSVRAANILSSEDDISHIEGAREPYGEPYMCAVLVKVRISRALDPNYCDEIRARLQKNYFGIPQTKLPAALTELGHFDAQKW